MTDSARAIYRHDTRILSIEDAEGDWMNIVRAGGALTIHAPHDLCVDAKEFIEQVARFADLEVVVGERKPVPTQPASHVQVAEGEPKRPQDFYLDVVPRFQAVEVTEEYARSGLHRSGSKVSPKFDERTGALRGVEVREEDGEMSGRLAQVGDYLVFGPDCVEIYWPDHFRHAYRKVDA